MTTSSTRAGASAEWELDGDSINLVHMPLFHLAGSGWAIAGLWNGCESVLLRDVDPAAILAAVDQHGITNMLQVPIVLQMMLETPGVERIDFSTVRAITYGGSPINESLLARSLETFNCRFIQSYGMTEATGSGCVLRAEQHHPHGNQVHRLRSVGVPYPWVELRVVDPDTFQDVPEGAVGELWLRSRAVMKGYWNMPEETARTLLPGGWLRTGDAGYRDDEGFVYLHDRVKDMIVTGGENVYPAEVENVLQSHPAVNDAAVLGVPHERWGETPKALVVPTPGASITEEELVAHAKKNLAGYKCPTTVEFRDDLPRNPSGKVLKRALREEYWSDHDRRVH